MDLNEIQLHMLESLMDGIPPDTIATKIEESGPNQGEALEHFGRVTRLAHASGRRREASKDHAHWMAGVRRRLAHTAKLIHSVDYIDQDSFYRDFYRLNRPLLFSDVQFGTDVKFQSVWSFERLKRQFGEITLPVMRFRSPGQNVPLRGEDSVENFGDFIDEILTTTAHDLYLTPFNKAIFGPLGSIVQELCPLPNILDARCPLKSSLWLGPKGTISGLHNDTNNSILTQLLGSKRVLLFPPNDECFLYHDHTVWGSPVNAAAPDLEKYPLYRFSNPREVTLTAGSALFIPVGWWHFVESLSPSFSVSMANFFAPNTYPENMFG